MATKKARRGPTPRPTRQDATVRNVRASVRRDKAAKGARVKLATRVEELERQVGAITKSLRALAIV